MDAKPVLLVTTSTFPRWEGDSEPRFVYDLCIRLTEAFKVVVLAPHATGAATDEVRDGLHIHRYRYAPPKLETLAYEGGITANLKQKAWKWLLLPSFFLMQMLATRQLLERYHVSAIHAHWLIPQGIAAIMAAKWSANKPSLLCTSHGGDLYGLQDKVSQGLKRWVIRNSQAITVVSTPMAEKIHELAREQTPPLSVIPMGTDLENTFVPNPAVKRLPNQLLFVGRLVEKKGVEYLLRALVEVRKAHPDMTLVIAGSGPLREKLEKLAIDLGLSEQTRFVGRLEHAGLVRLYQESTLAVFPFIQARNGDMEGLGLVMVEAMGCGCPVVASDLPAVRDVLSPETGHLANSADVQSLTAHILSAIGREPPAAGLLQQKFGWRHVAECHISTLQEMTRRKCTLPISTTQGAT